MNQEEQDAKQALIDRVLEKIKEEMQGNDITAIDELLSFVPIENLKGYLCED